MMLRVRILRLVATPLRSADTYRRWLHLLLGGVLFVPFYLAVLVVLSLLFHEASPGEPAGFGGLGIAGLAVAAVLGAATAAVPAVHLQQLQLARVLLGGRLAAEPAMDATSRRSRARGGAWLGLHFVVGFAVSLATMVVLTEAAMVTLSAVTTQPVTLLDGGVTWSGAAVVGQRPWLGPLLGAGLLVALVQGVALVGAGAARLAPVLLGPSVADRLATAQVRADDLVERNRLAAELHDSLGHALSVVALQSGAAARVIDTDPDFAREALGAVAEQARAATAELDHLLGVLREEAPTRAPARSLTDLASLVEAARTTGTRLRLHQTGPVTAVPPAVSREAYRLVQEGVTNALRHGDGRAPIEIDLTAEAEVLRLAITNPVGRSRGRGGGRGLASMAERVRLLGGHLDAVADDGTWRLAVVIPLRAATPVPRP